MGFDDKLRDAAKGLGKEIAGLAKETGNELLGDLKEKLAGEADQLKRKASKAVSDAVDQQKKKLAEKASDLLGKK